jgi:hypothetical protein
MNKKILTLAAVIAVVSVGTYVVLTLVKPHNHEEAKVADVYSSDQIFAGKLDPNAPDETPTNGAATTSGSPAAASAPAEATPATNTEAAPAVATAADAAPAASADTMATPVEAGGATPAAAPATAAPAQQQVAAAEPAPAPASTPPPSAEPAPAPATAEPAPAVKPAPAPKPKHVAKKKTGGGAASTKAWWPAENPDQLSLVYAGSASFKKAVVLLFNGAFFKPDSANANIKVTDSKGAAVSGSWEPGENNRRMLVFPVSANGTYKISVGADLTDSKNRKLGKALKGAVTVQ